MRVEDWHDWVEKQFLDTNPPPEKPESAETELPAAEIPASPIPELASTPVGASHTAAATTVVARSPISPPSAVLHARPEPADDGTIAEIPIPEIKQYFSFLRPTTDVAPPEPAQAAPIPPEGLPESGPSAAVVEAQVTEPATPAEQPAAPADLLSMEPAPEPVSHSEPATPEPQPNMAEQQPDRTMARPHRLRPRARSMRTAPPPEFAPPLTSEEFWKLTPRHVRTLIAMGQDDTVQNSYKRQFKESRLALIERLLDPTLSLEETARLLNVCPTTVRRYTNKGLLRHQRTPGDQRRFRLSDVLSFMESRASSGEA